MYFALMRWSGNDTKFANVSDLNFICQPIDCLHPGALPTRA